MKTLKLFFALMAAMLMAVSCGSNKEQKVLVLYYSQTSNTETVAKEIVKNLNADMEEIHSQEPYTGDFKATINRCIEERENGYIPANKPLQANIADYDVIFIGYPIWFGTYAPPVAALLNDIDLSGKKVVPFCTFGSGGLESSVADLAKAEPMANILPGYGVRAARMAAMPQEVDQFLKENGFIKGSYVKLKDFTKQHEVSREEIEIFKMATDNYPMLNAVPKTVASRAIPNGTEYMYCAYDIPHEEDPNLPTSGDLTIYIIKLNDAKPEFTRVVR